MKRLRKYLDWKAVATLVTAGITVVRMEVNGLNTYGWYITMALGCVIFYVVLALVDKVLTRIFKK